MHRRIQDQPPSRTKDYPMLFRSIHSLWILFLAFQLLGNAFLSESASSDPTSTAVLDPADLTSVDPVEKTKSVLIDGMPFVVPAGCELELVADSELCRWPIVATWDGNGDLVVAESVWNLEKKETVQQQLVSRPHRIVRLSDKDRNGVFDTRQVVAESLSFPEGVLCLGNDILVTAPPQIWRLIDKDGDGVCEDREVWFDGTTLTGCANDLHGPWLGPDGWIYWSKSAFAEQSHEVLSGGRFVSSASHLYRRHPKGGPIEPVMTGGMDNLVDIAWHPNGERFFCATFLHHPRNKFRDGIGHAMYGAVFGKPHKVLDGHAKTGPLMEPLVELGPAAPAGLLHLKGIDPSLASQLETPDGKQVSGYLAAAQFNLHKISIHPLQTSPESAGYSSDSMDLISSPRIDFHPVDVLLDRDSSLIVLDTGGWYDLCCPSSGTDQRVALGGIYRLRGATSDRRDDSVRWPPITDVLPNGLSPSRSIDELAKVLVEEPKNEDVWRQIDRLLESKSADVRIAALNLISLYRHEGSRDAVRSCLYHFGPLEDRDARTARLAAECIGRLGMQGKVDGDPGDYLDLLQLLSRYKSDRSMQHAVILAMIEGDEFEMVRKYLVTHPVLSTACAIALEQRNALREEDAAAICRLASSEDESASAVGLEILQRHPPWSNIVLSWLEERFAQGSEADVKSLAPILSRWSDQASVQQLVRSWLERSEDCSSAQRECLLQTLRGAADRPIPTGWATPLAAWIEGSQSDQGLADVLPLLQFGDASSLIAPSLQRKIAAGDTVDPGKWLVWSRGMPLGAAIPKDRETVLVDACIQGKPEDRKLALATLQRVKLDDREAAGRLVDGLSGFGPLELPIVLDGLLRIDDPEIDRRILQSLPNVGGAKSLNIDRVVGMLKSRSQEIVDQWRQTLSQLQQPSGEIAKAVERWLDELPKGDATRGYHVFRSDKAACSACHRIGYVGGEIGPVLSQIGRSRTRRDLVEAIVFPSARLEQSYRSTKFRMNDGEIINGLVVEETPQSIILQVAADRRVAVLRADIDESGPSEVSIMPAGLDQQLSRQDFADLLAFLENAK